MRTIPLTRRQKLNFLAVTVHTLFWALALIVLTIWAVISGYVWTYANDTFQLVIWNTYTEAKIFTLAEVPETLAVIPLMLIIGYISVYFYTYVLRKRVPANDKASRLIYKTSQFNIAVLALRAGLVEEAVFRWFPLAFMAGFFTQIPLNILIIGSSCVFAAVHLPNFSRKGRNIIFVSPQFFLGLILSYAFLRWGFSGAAFIHFIYDLALLLMVKNGFMTAKYSELFRRTQNAA